MSIDDQLDVGYAHVLNESIWIESNFQQISAMEMVTRKRGYRQCDRISDR
ncbi:hypothetical protein C7S16_0664 [Burkholderia thailandensis]|uniref:Transposase n=1 Tax=Burkholderia thailandensis TaxID=57975 RepID=A0AAW9D1Y6_BURTH|nr:hypothetical protein [Burkholderia thailandensis]MDW9254064.1 hypothetical protein [Burkholderia thailandensis]